MVFKWLHRSLRRFQDPWRGYRCTLRWFMGFMTGLGGVYVKVPGIHKGRLSWEDSSCPRGFPGFFFPNKLYGVCCPTMQHSQSKNGSGGGGGVRSWRRQMLVKLRHPEWKDIAYCSGNVFIDDKNKENKTHVSGLEVHVVFTSCVGCLLGIWFTRYPAESFGSNIFLFSFNPVRFVLLLFKIFVHFNVFFLITVWSLRRCAWDFSRSF